MNTHDALFQRGQQLMSMSRTDEAIATFRRLLLENPQHGPGHAMLALCLAQQEQYDSALEEAHRAIAVAPDMAFGHYVQGVVLARKEQYREGLAAMDRAIAMDPETPSYHTSRARILSCMNRREEACESCYMALQFDPEDTEALSVLAVLESQEGNRVQAEHAAKAAVQSAPNDASSYIALGYQCTFANRPKEAFEAFRQALRLEPNNEQAREGLVLALQMHHFLYRRMFTFFAWMARLGSKMQWAVIVGILVFQNVIRSAADASPMLGVVLWPVLGLCVAFVLLTWVINPLSYAVLLLSRWGRLALSVKDKATGLIFAIMFSLSVGVTLWGAALSASLFFYAGLSLLALTLTVVHILESSNRAARIVSGTFSVVIFIVMLLMITSKNPHLFGFVALLFIAFQFIYSFFAIRAQQAIT